MTKQMVEGFRLSPQQEHLWLLRQADRGSAYRAWSSVLIEGQLDTGALNAALASVVNRHEILHTSFCCLPGMSIPLQVINDSFVPRINHHDLSELDDGKQEASIDSLIQRSDLSADSVEDSLFHVSLVKLSSVKHLMLINLSSLCADVAGLKILVKEISRSYEACLQGEEISYEPMQYADFSEWQNELLNTPDTEAGREYWRKKDIADLLTFKLPFEKYSLDKPVFSPESLTSVIGRDLAKEIEYSAHKFETTPSTFLLACWQVLMWRLTSQPDLIVGTAFDGRKYEQLEEALGLFAKYLPIHSQLGEQSTFSEILKQIHESAHDVYECQEYFTWEHIGETPEHPGPEPFFPLCFEYEQQSSSYSAAGLLFSITEQRACIDRFKLKLRCISKQDGFAIEFHYDSSIYTRDSISRLADQFATLLSSALANPQSAVSDLEIVSEDEKKQLLEQFNRTEQPYPRELCIHEMIERQADLTPDNVAVVYGAEQVSYRELEQRANQIANYLNRQGVGPEQVVAICMNRSIDMVVALLGIPEGRWGISACGPRLPGAEAAVHGEGRGREGVAQQRGSSIWVRSRRCKAD